MHDVFLMKELPGSITCTLPDRTKLALNLQDRCLALRVKVFVFPTPTCTCKHFEFGVAVHDTNALATYLTHFAVHVLVRLLLAPGVCSFRSLTSLFVAWQQPYCVEKL